MADRNIKKEKKKPKKSSEKSSGVAAPSTPRPIAVQPELIKKEKKPK